MKRVVALVLTCGAIAGVVGSAATVLEEPVQVEASGACSEVIPVDALAEGVFGHGASGALVAGLGSSAAIAPVVAGGAAPVIGPVAAAVGGVMFVGAVFLSSVYGTCKFLDFAVGDRLVLDDAPLHTWEDVTVTPLESCLGLLGATAPASTATTDRC